MKSYQKLDKTIDYLIKENDPFGKKSAVIHKELNIANDALEQHLILDKLVKDGYAFAIIPKDEKTGKEYPNDPCYGITFEGFVFKENGAYAVEYAIRNRELITRKIISWLNPAWRMIAFATAILTLIFGSIKAYVEIINPILNN